MRFATIIAPFLVSLAMATPAYIAVRGGGGGDGGSGTTTDVSTTTAGGGDGGAGSCTATVTVTTTTTTTATGGVSTTTAPGGDDGGDGSYTPCGTIYSVARCCTLDLLNLGVASFNCATTPIVPSSAADFAATCKGTTDTPRAECCVITAANLGVLCTDPTGITNA